MVNGGERYGFFIASPHLGRRRMTLLARDFLPVPDEEVRLGPNGFELPPSAWLPARNRAHMEGAALIEAHSHPGHLAGFSTMDDEWSESFATYILEDLPGRPYAATVWSKDSMDGRIWPAPGKVWMQLDELRVVGLRLDRLVAARAIGRAISRPKQGHHERYARQVQAIGEFGQRALAEVCIGVVGLGGLGSVVVQQAAYLGVRNFVLVDRDSVDETNLNRLVGSGPRDLDIPKTAVAAREIRRVAGPEDCEISIYGDLRTAPTLKALTDVDILVGAVDNDGARHILNELAVAFLTPYFDLGVGIEVEEGGVVQGGGRVIFVHPDGPCLLCVKGYSPRVAGEELMSAENRNEALAHSYLEGSIEPSPSVVTLNTVVAGLAMTEFLALVAAFRSPREYVYYDLNNGGTVPTKVQRNPKCVVCAHSGAGGGIHLERYVADGVSAEEVIS